MDAFAVIYILCYLFFITRGEHKLHKREEIPLSDYRVNGTYNDFWSRNPNAGANRPPVQPRELSGGRFRGMPQQQRGEFQQINVLSVPDCYEDDDDNISLIPNRKYVKAKKTVSVRANSAVSSAGASVQKTSASRSSKPVAHIRENPPAVNKTAPDRIETPDGIYVRMDTQTAPSAGVVVSVSPDEVVNESSYVEETASARPKLGRGYMPKSTVQKSDDGYKVYNCSDE